MCKGNVSGISVRFKSHIRFGLKVYGSYNTYKGHVVALNIRVCYVCLRETYRVYV